MSNISTIFQGLANTLTTQVNALATLLGGSTPTPASTAAQAVLTSSQSIVSTMNAFYLGTFAVDPTVDGNSLPVQIGAQYYNSATSKNRIYTTTGWQDIADSAGAMGVNAASSAAASAAAAVSAATSAVTAATQQNNIGNTISNGTGTDGGALTGTETTPMSRGNGILQTTWSKVATYVLSAIANGTSTDVGAITGAEIIPASRGAGLLQVTITELNGWMDAQHLNQRILGWSYAKAWQLVSATRDVNEALVTASIVWPDGATGTFTTDTASTGKLGELDAWHVTYVNGTVTHTITQTAVTRDAGGGITAQPAITIA